MQENAADGTTVKENFSAAVLGAIVGYFLSQHWPSIEAFLRMFLA
jgi:hypothetical protein